MGSTCFGIGNETTSIVKLFAVTGTNMMYSISVVVSYALDKFVDLHKYLLDRILAFAMQ